MIGELNQTVGKTYMSIEPYARKQADTKTQSVSAQNVSFSSLLDQTTAGTYSDDELNAIFQKAADTYQVPVDLLKAVAQAESNFDTTCVSKSGARGVMQLMPETAAELGVTNSFDAEQNIMGGANYLSQKLKEYDGNVSLALAAYNAGSANVNKYGGIPPFTETQNYVKKILNTINNA